MKQQKFLIIYGFIFALVLVSCTSFNYTRLNGSGSFSSLVLTGYGRGSYKHERIITYLDELKALNANTASLLYTCYVDSVEDSSVDCASYSSPSIAELAHAIDLAKQRSFKVNVRFYIDIRNGTWRCHYNPRNKKAFFSSFNSHLKRLSEVLEKRKVELFIIGAELCELTKSKYTGNWHNSIELIKSKYNGLITYGANWGKYKGTTEYKQIGFWKALDFIGIDHYLPIPSQISAFDISDYQSIKFNEYLDFASSVGKDVLITELGFPGVENGRLAPAEWRAKGKSDELDQAQLYRYTLSALKKYKEIKGVFIWRKESKDVNIMKTYRKQETDYGLYKRKAWYEIQNSFSN